MYNYYWISPRLKKSLFKEPKMVYDVHGSYAACRLKAKLIHSWESKEVAESAAKELANIQEYNRYRP